jgi:glutamate decarboxylase
VPSRAAGEPLADSQGAVRNTLVDSRRPEDLVKELSFSLPAGEGRGEEGLLKTIKDVLKYSVNTWDQGFMDKLYASTNPVCSSPTNTPFDASSLMPVILGGRCL